MTPTNNNKLVRSSSLHERIMSRYRPKDLSLIDVELLKIKSRRSRGFLGRLFERFTEEAMKAIMLSEEETRRLCHGHVGTDKILVGLLLGGSIAAKVLESMGINAKDVSVEADKISGRHFIGMDQVEKASEITPIDIPFTKSAFHTLELSYQEARKLGHNYIGSGHLLLALVSDRGFLAARVLANLGAKASNIRAEVLRMVEENNNETITSYQPSVAKLHEELSEVEKIQIKLAKHMTEVLLRLKLEKAKKLK